MTRSSQSNIWLGIILGALAIAGVTSHASNNVSGVRYDEDSFRMEAESASSATQQAQKSLNEFTQAIASEKPSYKYFSIQIKQNIPDQDNYTWLHDVTYENGMFSGVMTHEEARIANGLKADERLSITPAEVTDWSYIDGNKIIGSYMVRSIRDRMTADEREEHDAQVYAQIKAYY